MNGSLSTKLLHKRRRTPWRRRQRRRRRLWQKSINEIRGGKFSHFVCKRSIIHYSVCDFSRVSRRLCFAAAFSRRENKTTGCIYAICMCTMFFRRNVFGATRTTVRCNLCCVWFVVPLRSCALIFHLHKLWTCECECLWTSFYDEYYSTWYK